MSTDADKNTNNKRNLPTDANLEGPNKSKTKSLAYLHDKAKNNKNIFNIEPNMQGFFIMCDRNKESKAVREAYDILNSVIEELYPELNANEEEEESESKNVEDSIEAELKALKGKTAKKRVLMSMNTTIECLIFIRSLPPVNPVQVVKRLFENLSNTGIKRSRFISRILPVTDTCFGNNNDINALAKKILEPEFPENSDKPYKYAVQIKLRNNSQLKRDEVINNIAQMVPNPPHTVDLTNPDKTIIVEVFKRICAISVVEDFFKYKKFNYALVGDEAMEKNGVEGEKDEKDE